MPDKSTFYLQADEIDHITIRYTDFGEPLNRKQSIKKILFYYSCYQEVKRNLSDFEITAPALQSLSVSELYDLMIIVRNTLLYDILNGVNL